MAEDAGPRLGRRLPDVFQGDIWHSFTRAPIVVLSAAFLVVAFLAAAFAPWVAPYDPFDLASLDIMNSVMAPGEKGLAGE
ncbi:MAG: hypothetical protein OXF51_00595, partial [Alphaproteobacteria bacterium]|nr:hypothetical protein [Alphaproteobacteria bacterium]